MPAVEKAAFRDDDAGQPDCRHQFHFHYFNVRTPRSTQNIDREKAEQIGVPVGEYFFHTRHLSGSTYIQRFQLSRPHLRVTAQADARFRRGVGYERLRTRSSNGGMVPLAAVMTLKNDAGPYRVVRVQSLSFGRAPGDTARGYSSGQSLQTMGRWRANAAQGMTFEWTDLAYQQQQAGNTALRVRTGVLFVFLLLAAQYESVVLR